MHSITTSCVPKTYDLINIFMSLSKRKGLYIVVVPNKVTSEWISKLSVVLPVVVVSHGAVEARGPKIVNPLQYMPLSYQFMTYIQLKLLTPHFKPSYLNGFFLPYIISLYLSKTLSVHTSPTVRIIALINTLPRTNIWLGKHHSVL